MKIADVYSVKSIKPELCKDWLLNVHYAKRIPSISYAFGLFEGDVMIGVCTYGKPMSHTLIKNSFNGEYQDSFLELNRLVTSEGLHKNTCSFFVSQCLKKIPKPKVIVSYADTSQGHNGYVYQATNWVYTGLSAEFKDYMVKGLEHLHHATIGDMVGRNDKNENLNRLELLKERFGEENVYLKERSRKHRYFFFLGSRNDRKNMANNLKYEVKEYPKGENKRYSINYKPQTQIELF